MPFSYEAHGASRAETKVAGFVVDHNRVLLGKGDDVFARAKTAVREWQMFNFGWIELHPQMQAIETGKSVSVCANFGLLWALVGCRIVYVIDENENGKSRFGFAYGTLLEHIECGEERFLVEWNHSDDSVYYDLYAFSHPQHPLVKLARPVARFGQRQFALASMAAMKRAVLES